MYNSKSKVLWKNTMHLSYKIRIIIMLSKLSKGSHVVLEFLSREYKQEAITYIII